MKACFKLYINDIPLQFVEPGAEPENQDWTELKMRNHSDVAQIIWDIYIAKKQPGYFIRVDSVDAILTTIKNAFTVVIAAGGLVWNTHNDLLMIFRRGKWDLPKGKLDPGEDLETAALREVEEETKAKGLSLKGKLSEMYYVFKDHNKLFLKEIHWYNMSCNDDSPLIPQAKEEITEAVWVKKDEIPEKLKNTYESVRELVSGL